MKNIKDIEAGFTLVEMMVAIVLIGVVAGSLSTMFIAVQNIQRQASNIDIATRAAQREVETLRSNSYSSLTPGQTINFTAALPSTLPPGKTGTVIVSEPSTDIRRIDVSVVYTTLGKSRTITLSALIGAIGLTK